LTRAYISATFEDLQECRLAVQSALRQLDVSYLAMEAYVAEDRKPLDKCLADIETCDFYIGIFAWRYGFVPPNQTKSITQLEYERAIASHKDVLIFLLHEAAPWPRKFVDRGSDCERVDELREHLRAEHLCSFFSGPDELAFKVVTAVTRLLATANEPAAAEAAPATGRGLSEEVKGQYFRRLRQQYGGLDLDALTPQQADGDLPVQLASVFVEPSVREEQPPIELPREVRQRFEGTGWIAGADVPDEVDADELTRFWAAYRGKPLQRVFDVLCAPANRRVVLLGDPGAGKSAVARYVATTLAGANHDKRLAAVAGCLPIVVEMRSYAAAQTDGDIRTFLGYLVHRATTDGYRTEPAALQNHLVRGDPALVIFDGLDEIFDGHRRKEAASQIAAFANDFPAARILVTSRIPEYSRRHLVDAGFVHYTLQDLDADHTSEFLKRWFLLAMPDRPTQAVVQRDLVSEAIRRSPALTELAGNPMLLSILAIIGRHRMLPKQRWRLYEHAATVLVERWDDNRLPRDPVDGSRSIDAEDKRELLRRLAFDMQSGRGGLSGNYVDAEQLKRIFTEYLTGERDRNLGAAREAANNLIGQLRERNFILSKYGEDVYGFMHRTFLEFFCAAAILKKFQHTHEWTFDDIKAAFRAHWSDPSWREVLRLLAGQLYAPRTAELIEFLVTEVNADWPRREGPAEPDAAGPAGPPWNIALAAQCLAEMRSVTPASRAAELVLRRVIDLVEDCASRRDRDAAALLGDEILPAIETVGVQWPGRHEYLTWYRRQGPLLVASVAGPYAARIAAMLALPDDRLGDVFIEALDSTDDVRAACAALAGLGEVVRQAPRHGTVTDRGTWLSRLTRAASSDERAVVRLAAVQAIGAVVGAETEIRDVLLDRATKDGFAEARLVAVQALGERFRDDEAVIDALLTCQREDSQASVRHAALRVLIQDRQIGPTVQQALLDAVKIDTDADVVELAAVTLLNRSEVADEVRGLLLTRLAGDPAGGIRRVAVRVMGAQGHDDELIGRIDGDREPVVIREAATVLANRPGGPHERVCTVLIRRLAAERDEVIREVLVRVLNETCGDDPRSEGVLAVSANVDEEQAVRLAAVKALATHPPSDRRRALFVEVVAGDLDPPVRLAAVQALAADPDGAATAALASIAAVDTDVGVRMAAIRGLGDRRFAAEVGRQLVDLTDGKHHPQIRLAALEVLVSSRPSEVDVAAVFRDRATNDTVSEVFAAAAVAAVASPGGAAELWPVIARRAADDPNPRVRSAAVELLGSAAGFAGAAAVLADRLRSDPDPAVLTVAAKAVALMAPDEAAALLTARLTDSDPEIRCAAIPLLANRLPADAAARALVVATATDTNAKVRRAAVDALALVADLPDVRPTLIALTADTDGFVQTAANQILGRRSPANR
jgi:hypothetical protein